MLRSVLLVLPLVAAQSDWPHLCPNQPNDPWSQVRCPATASCSANGFSNGGGFGCCPWANATSCPSGYQCCPQGSTCNLVSGSGYSAVYTCLGGTAPIGGVTSKCPCKPGASQPPSTTKKNVLVIGDSLSIGYTPSLGTNLSDIAQVVHAPWDTRDGGAEESAYLEQCLDYWLRSPSGIPWTPDVILFNSGMHNLGTSGAGVPGQGANYSDYAPHMQAATSKLVAFAAASGGKTKLLLAMTTPYLCDASIDGIIHNILNVNASALASTYGIPVVDPYTAIVDKCGKAPTQSCFGETGCWCPHCPPGYSWLAQTVLAPAVRKLLSP